ncbi:MAG: hypothetical protein IJ282_00265 [Lachnospiraceae bacterium]|nr:hypothetical protein [Lachnospiraceae bacterium]
MSSSYRRYRQYQANRYQYKVDQITAPIVMMFVIGFITDYWWVIISGVAILFIMRIIKNKKRNEVEWIVDSMGDVSAEQEQETSFQKEEVRDMSTTEVGYINKNNQRNNGRTDKPGTDYGQWFYEMECLECGHKYHANGSNIYEKKCPNCQGKSKDKSTATGQKSTEAGYVNKNNQRNNGKTDIPGTGNGQWFYDMECLECGHTYHANGHDVWLRKCPKCQGGKP